MSSPPSKVLTVHRLNDVPSERQCGAKTRSGTPCRKWTLHGRTRCRNHGGRTPFGIASPNLKHGWYSKYFPYSYMRAVVQAREEQRRRLAMRLEAEGVDLAIADLMNS